MNMFSKSGVVGCSWVGIVSRVGTVHEGLGEEQKLQTQATSMDAVVEPNWEKK